MLLCYNLLLAWVLLTGVPCWLPWVVLVSKRRRSFWSRLGAGLPPSGARCSGALGDRPVRIWVHALSVGEVFAAAPLIEALQSRWTGAQIYLSVTTQTGFQVARKRLQTQVRGLFFAPFDFPPLVRRACARIDPNVVVLVESDIWPNFLAHLRRRRIPVVLANARLSARSLVGYRRLGRLAGAMFAAFVRICPQSAEDARRLGLLGVPEARMAVCGSLKFDQVVDTPDRSQTESLRTALNIGRGRPVWVAGSTHRGEEEVLAEVYGRLCRTFPGLVLIVVPRDPARAPAVQSLFHHRQFVTVRVRLPAAMPVAPPDAVRVIANVGWLNRLYALADATFVGGSLVDSGGHNPLEPAALAKPVCFGPYMGDFNDIVQLLVTAGAGVAVKDAAGLQRAIAGVLSEPRQARLLGLRAREVFQTHQGAARKIVDVVATVLENPAATGERCLRTRAAAPCGDQKRPWPQCRQ